MVVFVLEGQIMWSALGQGPKVPFSFAGPVAIDDDDDDEIVVYRHETLKDLLARVRGPFSDNSHDAIPNPEHIPIQRSDSVAPLASALAGTRQKAARLEEHPPQPVRPPPPKDDFSKYFDVWCPGNEFDAKFAEKTKTAPQKPVVVVDDIEDSEESEEDPSNTSPRPVMFKEPAAPLPPRPTIIPLKGAVTPAKLAEDAIDRFFCVAASSAIPTCEKSTSKRGRNSGNLDAMLDRPAPSLHASSDKRGDASTPHGSRRTTTHLIDTSPTHGMPLDYLLEGANAGTIGGRSSKNFELLMDTTTSFAETPQKAIRSSIRQDSGSQLLRAMLRSMEREYGQWQRSGEKPVISGRFVSSRTAFGFCAQQAEISEVRLEELPVEQRVILDGCRAANVVLPTLTHRSLGIVSHHSFHCGVPVVVLPSANRGSLPTIICTDCVTLTTATAESRTPFRYPNQAASSMTKTLGNAEAHSHEELPMGPGPEWEVDLVLLSALVASRLTINDA